MMKRIMTSVAALALLAAVPAYAESELNTRSNVKVRGDTGTYVEYSSDAETVTHTEVERSLEKAGNAIERTASKAVNAADNTAQSAGLSISDPSIAANASAENMIGKPVMNSAGERVGSVHDIILSQNGGVKSLIVADGGMMSLGDKKAAFDFAVVNGRDANGAILTSITEEQINNAKTFDYDMRAGAEADADTQIKAADETSVRELIGAKIDGPQGKALGTVEDIAIEGTQAAKVVIAHDQFLGLGGKKVGVAYGDLALSSDESGKPLVSLDAQQAAQLNTNL